MQKMRCFVPGNAVPIPKMETVRLDGSLPVSGAVRLPKGEGYGVVRDGRVVAWAVACLPDANGARNITVETDVRWRRQGLATACLCRLLREIEEPVVYRCEERNVGSAGVALAAGMRQCGCGRK